MRMTVKHLEAKVSIINGMLGFDTENMPPYPTPGVVHLYRAYGATGVHRIVNESGGVSSLAELGTMRETAQFLSGMIAALRIARDEQVSR